MDANEIVNYKINNIIKSCRLWKLCDPIAMKNGTEIEPNIYSRESELMYFILCTRALLRCISSVGILPFGTITFLNHRGLYIDINLHKFLRNPNTDLVTSTP